MKRADRVLIIEFQDKYSNSGDNEISNGTEYLAAKARQLGKVVETVFYLVNGSSFVGTSHYMREMNPLSANEGVLGPIREGLSNLTDTSELIIRGHGNANLRTITKVNPAAMANFLCDMGLKANCRINITSCKAGRGWDYADKNDVRGINVEELSLGSFAREFQQCLFIHGLRKNEIHARVQNVRVNADGRKTTRTHGCKTAGGHTHHQEGSKIILKGDGDGGSSYAFAD